MAADLSGKRERVHITPLGVLAGMPLTLSVLADLFGGITTDWLTKKHGLRVGCCGTGGIALLVAGSALISGAAVNNALASALLISIAAATANFLLGASWGVCMDIASDHAGLVSACMNTAGQIGGVLSPSILALVVDKSANWSAPLYLAGGLYLAGACCWYFIDPRKPIINEC